MSDPIANNVVVFNDNSPLQQLLSELIGDVNTLDAIGDVEQKVTVKEKASSETSINSYKKYLHVKCMQDFKCLNLKKKCPDDMFVIPNEEDYSLLTSYKLKKDQLKQICKYYKLKVSGTNNELLTRCYTYLKLSNISTKIQSMFRGFLCRFVNKLRGVAVLNRSLCVNESDFLTGDSVGDIPFSQFISYTIKSSDNDRNENQDLVYGFDILSLYNLRKNASESETGEGYNGTLNPWTRTRIPSKVFTDMRRIIKINKHIYKIHLDTQIEKESATAIHNLSIQERARRLFMEFDRHGYYTSDSWFLSLSKGLVVRFIHELADIWCYRAQLTNEIRRRICPSDPFRHANILIALLHTDDSLESTQKKALEILEAVALTGISNEDRSLGVIYILQAFTLVNLNARESLPFLYEAVAYN